MDPAPLSTEMGIGDVPSHAVNIGLSAAGVEKAPQPPCALGGEKFFRGTVECNQQISRINTD